MNFIDYLFYRIYKMHALNLRFGTIFTSVLQLSVITFFSFLPLTVTIGYLLSSTPIKAVYTILAYLLFIFYLYISRFYNVPRLKRILKKYKHKEEYNKVSFERFVNVWTFLCIPFSLIVILFVVAPIMSRLGL